MNKVDISIVICTHRRFDLLAGAVQSLVEQSALPDSYEVIVVDNDHQPNPEVQEIVSKAISKISIKYLHESKLGLSHARNAGGKLATSDYIGYMDDDAKANPKYIEVLLKILHEHVPDICGGPYYPFYLDPKPHWFRDIYGTGSHGDEARFLFGHEFLSGGNIILLKNLLEEIGWFHPKLGMKGRKLGYGEETMVQIKARSTHPGLKIYYDPELYVLHLVPAYKMSIWYEIRRAYQTEKYQVYFWMPETKHRATHTRVFLSLAKTLLDLSVNIFFGIVFRDRLQYLYWQNYVYEKSFKYFSALGGQMRLAADFFKEHFSFRLSGNE